MPKALKSCPKFNRSPNLVTLGARVAHRDQLKANYHRELRRKEKIGRRVNLMGESV